MGASRKHRRRQCLDRHRVEPNAFTSWTEAFEAGTVELYRLAVDERTGPRAPGEDEDAAPVG
ncbi:hypothetical protein [Variovorax rhizosphaerae]|uniref:Uncharacterized protein n=1 Tax=Variovorax rhizosphaerae TaxID=1836200 RepID=A0ABU8WZI8_9BURK